jgi:hypothetical protein
MVDCCFALCSDPPFASFLALSSSQSVIYPTHHTQGSRLIYKAVISYSWFAIVDVWCQRQQHLVAAATAARFTKFIASGPSIVDWMCESLWFQFG